MNSKEFHDKVLYLKPYLEAQSSLHKTVDLEEVANKFDKDLRVAKKALVMLIEEGYIYEHVSGNHYQFLGKQEPAFTDLPAQRLIQEMGTLYIRKINAQLRNTDDPILRKVLENLRSNLLLVYSDPQ